MEEVQQSLETCDRTSPLAEIISEWQRAVEHMSEELSNLKDEGATDAREVAKAVDRAVSSAKGLHPID